MSGQGLELANLWLRVTPAMPGVTDEIVKAFAPGTKAAEDEGKKAGSKWSGAMKGALGAAALGGAAIATVKGLYDIGSTFDDVTDTIRVGTGAQGVALDGLISTAKAVGTQVPADFDKIGSTVADLNTRMGLSGETLETVASQYLEAGRILGEDIDIGTTSAAFSAFKIEGEGVSAAMDDLFRVSQATGVGMNDLAAGVKAQAPALQTLGFSFQDSISLLGSLDKAGLNAQQVLGGMSKGMVTLAKAGEEPSSAFKRVTGEIQGFVSEGNTAAALDLSSKLFGTKGASQFVAALSSGVLNMNDLMAATGATGDSILGLGGETMDFAEKWQVVQNKAMVALEPIANALFTGLSEGLTQVMPFLEGLGSWMSENTEVIGIIAAVIGVTLVAAFVAWAASIWAANAALLANPITWIVLLLAGLVAGIVWVATQTTFFQDTWEGAMEVIGAIVDWVWTSVLKPTFDAIGATFSWLYNSIIKPTADWIAAAVRIVGDTFTLVFGGVGDTIRGAFDGVVNFIKGVINSIIDGVNTVIDGINTVAAGVKSVTGGAVDIHLGKIPRLAKGATVLPSPGGTVAVLAEAGKPETVVDTGMHNEMMRRVLADEPPARSGGDQMPNLTQEFRAEPIDIRLQMRQADREARRLAGVKR